jgi:hypothetical protein
MLTGIRPGTHLASVATTSHWSGLYARRLATARAQDTGLADDLAVLVDGLNAFAGDDIALVIIDHAQHSYLIWVAPDASSVVALFRAPDRRVPH